MQTALSLPKGGMELDELNADLEALSLTEFLRWSLATFGEKIAHVTSFDTARSADSACVVDNDPVPDCIASIIANTSAPRTSPTI